MDMTIEAFGLMPNFLIAGGIIAVLAFVGLFVFHESIGVDLVGSLGVCLFLGVMAYVVGEGVGLGHANSQRELIKAELSEKIGAPVALEGDGFDGLVAAPASVEIISESFELSYELEGKLYQPSVVAKPTGSSENIYSFELYLKPGTDGELLKFTGENLQTMEELEG